MPKAVSESRCWLLALIVGVGAGCGGGEVPAGESRGSDAAGPGADGARVDDPSTPEDESQPLAAAGAPTKTDPCFSAEQSFAWELYGSVFSRCIGCHNSFGWRVRWVSRSS